MWILLLWGINHIYFLPPLHPVSSSSPPFPSLKFLLTSSLLFFCLSNLFSFIRAVFQGVGKSNRDYIFTTLCSAVMKLFGLAFLPSLTPIYSRVNYTSIGTVADFCKMTWLKWALALYNETSYVGHLWGRPRKPPALGSRSYHIWRTWSFAL